MCRLLMLVCIFSYINDRISAYSPSRMHMRHRKVTFMMTAIDEVETKEVGTLEVVTESKDDEVIETNSNESKNEETTDTVAISNELIEEEKPEAATPTVTLTPTPIPTAPVGIKDPVSNGASQSELLQEQLKELREGLSSFQSSAYEAIYDKPLKWQPSDGTEEKTTPTKSTKGTPPVSIVGESKVKVEVGSEVIVKTEDIKAVASKEDIIDDAPVAKSTVKPSTKASAAKVETPLASKAAPAVQPQKLEAVNVADTFEKVAAKAIPATKSGSNIEESAADEVDAIPISGVPLGSAVEDDSDNTQDILKAQQAVSMSFLSSGLTLDEANLAAILAEADSADEVVVEDDMEKEEKAETKATARPAAKQNNSPFGGFSFGAPKTKFPDKKLSPVKKEEPVQSSIPESGTPTSASAPITPKTTSKKSPVSPFAGFNFGAPKQKMLREKVVDKKAVASSSTIEPVMEPLSDSVPVAKAVSEQKIPEKKDGGLFNFGLTPKPRSKLVPKQVEAVTEVNPTPEASPAPVPVKKETKTSSPFSFGFPKARTNSKPETKKSIEKNEEPAAPAVATKATSISKKARTPVAKTTTGLFGFSFGQPKKKQSPLQIAASKLLNNDQKQIGDFQSATDSYRSSDLSATKFIGYLVSTFGEDDLDLILKPLIEELPEKDLGAKLNDANEKRMKDAAKSSGGFFGNLFKPKDTTASKAIISSVSTTKPTSKISGKKSDVPKATTSKAVSKSSKLSTKPSKVVKEGLTGLPSSKRAFVNAKVRSFKTNRIDAKSVVSSLTNELGKERALSVIKDITAQLPNDLANQLNAAAK